MTNITFDGVENITCHVIIAYNESCKIIIKVNITPLLKTINENVTNTITVLLTTSTTTLSSSQAATPSSGGYHHHQDHHHIHHHQVRVVGAGADESRANYYTCSGVETGEARLDVTITMIIRSLMTIIMVMNNLTFCFLSGWSLARESESEALFATRTPTRYGPVSRKVSIRLVIVTEVKQQWLN